MHRTVDDKTWFVMFYSDTRPTKCYKYDRKNKEVKHLFARYKALEQYSLSPMNPVIIKSRDGLDLVSYITFPKNTELNKQIYPKNPLPLVLLVHDEPDQRDKWGMNTNHQWLANRGYAVLSVNFRGSEGFGKRFLSSGYGEWGQKMQDDLIDAVNWAIKNKIAEPKKIAIMGVGYGGYAALAGLTFTPELFACSVDIAGPPNLATISNYFIQDARLDRLDKVKLSLLETAEKLYRLLSINARY
ncbi:prolyl oligopeptidase family protein [Rickettsia endosymbiont of Ixodes pacificus]|uniref:alpha/beta hydrolase family protein n=1 Tax=Rickettsia endosymbiont of Ixodes pacificus TaxID=1133329 RepID=UPI00061E9146|nr:prolyl oligopeptidase family serine peptidase [Rickettsia endosymbiont of Ixodes pacificus]KJW03104.1 prolyl oligopeptidase family protein [Rickettsia endosymbiont of Ixodes pacificus]